MVFDITALDQPLVFKLSHTHKQTRLMTIAGFCLLSKVAVASGRTPDCGAREPRFESHRGRFITTVTAIYSLGHVLCTLTAVPRSTQPSTLCGTVKWVSAYELGNDNKWRWCLQMVAADRRTRPKSVGLVWGLAATRRSVCIHQMNRVNSRNDYVMMTAP